MVALVVTGSALLVLSLTWLLYFFPEMKKLLASYTALEIERRLDSYHRHVGQWPTGSNTDILLALRGNNPQKMVFVQDGGIPVQANAFVDQWDSPFYFRFEADGRPQALSPGPNKKPGDADDIDSSAARDHAAKRYQGGIPPWDPENPAPNTTPTTPAPTATPDPPTSPSAALASSQP